MIWLFTGDPAAARAKALSWVRATRAKVPTAPYIRLEGAGITHEALADAATARGLFHDRSLAFVNDPFALAEGGEALLAAVPALAASENAIYVYAPKLLKVAEPLRAAAVKVFDEAGIPAAKRGFNASLADALGARDGRALWRELATAWRSGERPEEVHGLLHWKARDLMKKGGRKWTPDEARELSVTLIALLSESRGGDGLPLDRALERFALALR